MMNRPRPRKLINVIKTSSPENEEKESEKSKSQSQITTEIHTTIPLPASLSNNLKTKPVVSSTIPSVPQFKSIPSSPSIITSKNNNEIKNTIKSSTVPPPPNYFSGSPKSSSTLTSSSSSVSSHSCSSSTLSPKSSGEIFLDVADRAADYIGGAFLNSFKSLNLSDSNSKPVKITLPSDETDKKEREDDNPFADIMKKLKSETFAANSLVSKAEAESLLYPTPKTSIEELTVPALTLNINQEEEKIKISNLMDEEPPESFEKDENPDSTVDDFNFSHSSNKDDLFNYSNPHSQVKSKAKTSVEPSPFIKSAFSNIEHKLKIEQEHPLSNVGENEISNEKCIDDIDNYNNVIENEYKNDIVPELKFIDELDKKYQLKEIEKESIDTLNIKDESSLQSNSNSIDFFSVSSPPFDTEYTESPTSSPTKSTSIQSNSRTGFRASLLKQGLSALERIGKSTADVVVSTRNKLNETSSTISSINTQKLNNVITPNFNDRNSSFYDVFQLYGGYSKLQDLQMIGVRASIKIKLTRRENKKDKNFEKNSFSFDFNIRREVQTKISQILHPDRIMESIDDSDSCNLLFPTSDSQFKLNFPTFYSIGSDEMFCLQRLLKSLDGIIVEKCRGDSEGIESTASATTINNENQNILIEEINSTNRRRHVICQLTTLFCNLLLTITTTNTSTNTMSSNYTPQSILSIAQEVSTLTSQLIKYLQTNFESNCEDHTLADRDQQLAIKLLLDSAYSVVPLLFSA